MIIAGLILMGGKNRRMDGTKKAFLTDGEKPFISAWQMLCLRWIRFIFR